jgi:uncharacterized protein (TIGR00251 family)
VQRFEWGAELLAPRIFLWGLFRVAIETTQSVTLTVRVVPRSRRNEIVGLEAGILKVRLVAPPVEGRANEALIRFLAKSLGVAQGRVEIIRGETARTKLVRVRGISASRLKEILVDQ